MILLNQVIDLEFSLTTTYAGYFLCHCTVVYIHTFGTLEYHFTSLFSRKSTNN